MGILDLSAERAAIVRELEGRGVPVAAWLLLDVDDGYWLNADNPERGTARYRETIEWAKREQVQLHRIGLDIEFPRALGDEFNRNPRRTVWKAFRERRSFTEVYHSERAYADLVGEIRSGGRTVESYHFPYMIDERATGRALLRRCFALVDVHVDVEVFMLYASYLGRAAAHSYFDTAPAIALGVTGGGVNHGTPKETARLLTWERLEEDLVCSSRHTGQLYVFSLEGCVWRDFLPRFEQIDWAKSYRTDTGAAARAERGRRWLRRVMQLEPLADLIVPSRRTAERREAAEDIADDGVSAARPADMEKADGRLE